MQMEQAGGTRAAPLEQPGGPEPSPLLALQPGGPEPAPSRALQPAELALAPGGAATVTAFSRTMRLYSSPVPGGSAPSRPLVVLLPWFGARSRSIARYLELYLPRGLDVLVVESDLSHFLWPRHGLAYAACVLGLLQGSQPFCSRPLLVHAFSIGGYTFAQMMVHMSREPQRHQQLAERIRGLIYDSLVTGSLGDMALGVAQMSSSAALRPLVRGGTRLYFSLLHCCTVRYYKAAQDVFFRPPLRCPVLVFYCCNDPLSDPARVQELLESWRGAGILVWAQGWQDSRHAAHLRQHPQEYQQVLQGFLEQLDMALLRARL